MNANPSLARRLVVYVALACMNCQTAYALPTDISTTPLSSGTTPVLPNVLFILDDSSSMGQEALPDYVEAASLGNPAPACPRDDTGSSAGTGFVPAASGTSADCNHGDAPYYAGGEKGYNGIYYDPTINYLPALKANGTTQLSDYTSGGVYDLNHAALTPSAFIGGTNVNLTSSSFKVDRTYCNATGGTILCKKNGETSAGALIAAPVDNDSRSDGSTYTLADGQFPYRAHKSNSSAQVFGLPELMSGATWTRSTSTITATTAEPHGLTTTSPNNRIYVINPGNGNQVNATVTAATSTTFTYTGPASSGGPGELVYRKHTLGPAVVAVRVASSTTVTVTSAAHGLTTGDRVNTFNHATSNVNATGTPVSITRIDNDKFSYTSGASTAAASGTISWVRSGLYNVLDESSNYPTYYTIQPVEYCRDAALTDCAISTTLGTAPTGTPPYSFPAYTRFCKTYADSVAPGAVSGSTGSPATARCRSKFVDSVDVNYVYPRFGLFKRTVIKTTANGGPASYPKHANRVDCAGVSTCTYLEEVQNYARWYTFYRTRMQTMKTAAGRAFLPFISNLSAVPPRPHKLRVGFLTINPSGDTNAPSSSNAVDTANKYLKINNFELTHATNWYSRLYSQGETTGTLIAGTPLREALSIAGWIYAGKLNQGITYGIPLADDPIQASCQRNFSILTTDGYWTSRPGKNLVGTGGAIGNQDNTNNVIDAPYTAKMVSRDTGTYDGNLNSSVQVDAGASIPGPGGSGTLADVALYYYRTDLRSSTTGPVVTANTSVPASTNVSTNNVSVKSGNKDFVTHQHMVTFTVGIVDGLMRYQADYETATTGDFADIKNGATGCTFNAGGACNWPAPLNQHASGLDDLWHAAVNGRGTFYSARDPAALTNGLSNALTALNVQVAAAAASATSSPNITQTDRQIFSTTYQTDTWAGKIVAQKIDAATGAVESAIDWSAETVLLTQVAAASDSRNIYTFTGSGTKVKPFKYADLTATEKTYFDGKCTAGFMSQCGGTTPLVGTPLADANDGTKLVNYLRGQTGLEAVSFRDRRFIDPVTELVTQTVLGDTINAKPAFVRNPLLNFGTLGSPGETYADFKAAKQALNSGAGRSPRLYIGANDGYLHAFDGNSGAEAWAYLPKFLMPGLPSLASFGYSGAHSYFVDGSPEATDVFDTVAGVWKTILVGGLNGGGRGFFALDITDPVTPKGLWEFCSSSTHCAISDVDLGLSYGNPVIGRRSSDNKWVVVVSSGLNNANADGSTGNGDGKGHLWVLDAISGAVLEKINTPGSVGSTASPSGLMKISALYISANTDPVFRYIYAGDQLGNVWRADLGAATATIPVPPSTMIKLATLKDSSSPKRAQPITTRPVLTKIDTDTVVMVGTGRYIGQQDLADQGTGASSWQQTVYAFKDKGTDYGSDLRTDALLVQQNLTSLSPTSRSTSTTGVDWDVKDGWYMNFNPSFGSPSVAQSPGERVNIDMELILGTLVVVTNVPIPATGVACEIGGSSWLYQLDFRTGTYIANAPGQVAATSLGSVIAVGIAVVQLPSGAIKGIVTTADTVKTVEGIIIGGGAGSMRRFSYRER